MSTNNSSSSSGIGVIALLGVVFVTLRLLGIIHWSWWLVTLPFWGGIALLLSIAGILFGLALLFSPRKRRTL